MTLVQQTHNIGGNYKGLAPNNCLPDTNNTFFFKREKTAKCTAEQYGIQRRREITKNIKNEETAGLGTHIDLQSTAMSDVSPICPHESPITRPAQRERERPRAREETTTQEPTPSRQTRRTAAADWTDEQPIGSQKPPLRTVFERSD